MRMRFGIVVLTAVICMSSGLALAGGRGGRGGPVISAFGTLYDTRSPEWRAAGGNILVYQQLMQQKILRQQQQMELKQQQWLEKAARNTKAGVKKDKAALGSTPPLPAFDEVKKKKKRPTYIPKGTATSPDPGTSSTAKPGDTMDDPLKSPSTSPDTKKSATLAVPKGASGP